ncbi:hypothetical protein MML48_1g06319 [Holotrichia oblita]|uniref:Uncharacterized protein n=1 Tax=Holotrichia oblita TaxID=644536 RepID=A0ACB9TRY9_HOLOL|nr:hypothetical protein MML48_1g06319 [Holotrichia oblita]
MFIPRKPNGKVVLVLDGHASHCTSVELLELADANDVVLICLPSHTTHFLQPLDRAVFKSLKSNFYNGCRNWIRTNPGRQIKRSQFGNLLSQSWGISATQNNAIAGFKAMGICPFNSEAIPEHAYEISDQSVENPQAHNEAVSQSQSGAHKTLTQESAHSESMNVKPGTSKTTFVQCDENIPKQQCSKKNANDLFLPSTSRSVTPPPSPATLASSCSDSANLDKGTPGKLLESINPVPVITPSLKKRTKQLGAILTSPENIAEVKARALKRKKKNTVKHTKKVAQKGKYVKKNLSSSSESDADVQLESEDEGAEDDSNAECVDCGENYNTTKKVEDWIKCLNCKHWLHENCTNFEDLCQLCGIKKKK